VKEGYFLASVAVLLRFKHLIDFEKYLKHLFTETKTSKAMKSTEAHALTLGRLMSISAMVEARAFIGQQGGVNDRTLTVMLGCLIELFKEHEFLRESVVLVIESILKALQGVK